jgi:hypothetical protein
MIAVVLADTLSSTTMLPVEFSSIMPLAKPEMLQPVMAVALLLENTPYVSSPAWPLPVMLCPLHCIATLFACTLKQVPLLDKSDVRLQT